MSEWIRRSDREPPADTKVVFLFDDGDIEVMTVEAARNWPWSRWMSIPNMPLPDPPPREVTITISEEDARWFASDKFPIYKSWENVVVACRKALGEK